MEDEQTEDSSMYSRHESEDDEGSDDDFSTDNSSNNGVLNDAVGSMIYTGEEQEGENDKGNTNDDDEEYTYKYLVFDPDCDDDEEVAEIIQQKHRRVTKIHFNSEYMLDLGDDWWETMDVLAEKENLEELHLQVLSKQSAAKGHGLGFFRLLLQTVVPRSHSLHTLSLYSHTVEGNDLVRALTSTHSLSFLDLDSIRA